MRLLDVRCDGRQLKGERAGSLCNMLLLRIDPVTFGMIETKCPKCFTVREHHLAGAPVWR